MSKLRVAIIGCGAVTELLYLPVIAESDLFDIVVLVDKNIARAQNLAQRFGVPHLTDDYTSLPDKIDAAIIALPHTLHAPVSIDFLNRGIHVLVEKPMALKAADCDGMVKASRDANRVLAVGLVRRFLHSYQLAKRLISDGFLGRIESFDVRDGSVYNWPVASDFFFKKEAGGGVLADTGAHVLDTVLWWLGDYESFEYFDDAMGGVEADCEIHLRMKSGIEGIIELSRTRNLRNTAIIQGDKATLEVQMLGSQISIQLKEANVKVIGSTIENQGTESESSQSVKDIMKAQLEDWVDAIHHQREPYISGEEAAKSVVLIESCYQKRQPLKMSWLLSTPPKLKEGIDLRGKRVLITGGTGFIGGRLVERLVTECGAEVHVLVRNFSRGARIARFPIKMVQGDITDLEVVKKAMAGCEIVFHCAYGNTGSRAQQKAVNIRGTENVLKAALEHNVKRVVHISTISVYGQTKDGSLDESAPRKHSREFYANSKLKAEKLAFHYFQKHGLPVSIIQPTVVYGPSAPVWTIVPVNQLRSGRIVLIDGGNGLCNAVYIDDVVQAILLAATRESAVGEAFLISAENPVSWQDFYGAYEKMLGIKSTISMNQSELREFRRHYRKEHGTVKQVMTALRGHPDILRGIVQLPAVNRPYRLAQTILPDPLWSRLKNIFLAKDISREELPHKKPILPLTQKQAVFFLSRTHVSIEKARRQLGYQPNFNLEQGMQLTEKWLRFANLIENDVNSKI